MSTRLGWLSDIHLDFLDESGVREFLEGLAARPVDGWLLGGDIGNASSLLPLLRRFQELVPVPTYFVLGNHDFYGGSIPEIRERVRVAVGGCDRLTWLTAEDHPLILGSTVALVGDDSWADARWGDALGTRVQLNDFRLIRELTGLSRPDLVRTLNRLGTESAERLQPRLERAADLRENVVVLIHVPPFREAAWHEGKPSGDEWLPWFSCKAVGDAILASASSHPGNQFLVLCGHTHGEGVFSPAPNVKVLTAGAVYRAPAVQDILEFD